jgi:hypothetical protein
LSKYRVCSIPIVDPNVIPHIQPDVLEYNIVTDVIKNYYWDYLKYLLLIGNLKSSVVVDIHI